MDLRGNYTVGSALKARFRRYHTRPIWSTLGVCLLQDLTGMFAILPENQRSGGRSENRSGIALKIRIERYNFYFYLTETWEPISAPSFALISYQRSKNIHVNRLSSHLRILIFLSYLGHVILAVLSASHDQASGCCSINLDLPSAIKLPGASRNSLPWLKLPLFVAIARLFLT